MKTITYDETQWKLVPVEPTDVMAIAAIKVSLHNPAINGVAQYRAMLAAAPTPPADGQAQQDADKADAEKEALKEDIDGISVEIVGCIFNGLNEDGSNVFHYETGENGISRITKVRLINWICTGPKKGSVK